MWKLSRQNVKPSRYDVKIITLKHETIMLFCKTITQYIYNNIIHISF